LVTTKEDIKTKCIRNIMNDSRKNAGQSIDLQPDRSSLTASKQVLTNKYGRTWFYSLQGTNGNFHHNYAETYYISAKTKEFHSSNQGSDLHANVHIQVNTPHYICHI
jgi:hypothetical protein